MKARARFGTPWSVAIAVALPVTILAFVVSGGMRLYACAYRDVSPCAQAGPRVPHHGRLFTVQGQPIETKVSVEANAADEPLRFATDAAGRFCFRWVRGDSLSLSLDSTVGRGPRDPRFADPEALFGDRVEGGFFFQYEQARTLGEPVLLSPVPGGPRRVAPGVAAPYGWDPSRDTAARCQETDEEPRWSELDNSGSNWRLVTPFFASLLAVPMLILSLLEIRGWVRRTAGVVGMLAATTAMTLLMLVVLAQI